MMELPKQPFELPLSSRRVLAGGALALSLVSAAGLWIEPRRAWPSFLLSFQFLLHLSLAGLVVIAMHYVSGARWPTVWRRVPEAMAGCLTPLSFLGLLLLAGVPALYAWQGPQATADRVLQLKAGWLNRPFFSFRTLAYLGLWGGTGAFLLKASRSLDDPEARRRRQVWSGIFLAGFSLTFPLASVDWIMSLEPRWYSTLFGIYVFAGLLLAGWAAMTLGVLGLSRLGPLSGLALPSHLHDLGKLVFAFSNFWAYLWFSQYMLIWYGNLPEESAYYLRRRGGWTGLQYANLILNWGLPFLALASRAAKRHVRTLAGVCLLCLLGHWLDLYLMIQPVFTGRTPRLGFWDLVFPGAGLLVFATLFFRSFSRFDPVPIGDFFLPESLRHQT
jgi:hypothetical protein